MVSVALSLLGATAALPVLVAGTAAAATPSVATASAYCHVDPVKTRNGITVGGDAHQCHGVTIYRVVVTCRNDIDNYNYTVYGPWKSSGDSLAFCSDPGQPPSQRISVSKISAQAH